MPKSYPDFPHHTHIARVLRRLRRPLRHPRQDPFETPVTRAARAPTAAGTFDGGGGLRRADRRQRPPLGPALARARVPRAATRSRASRCTRTSTRTPSSCAARTSSSSAWATRRWTSPSTSPRAKRPTSPPAAARTSSRSTSSAARSTRSARPRRSRSPSAGASIAGLLRLYRATWSATGCPSPTIPSATRTRPSPAASSTGSRTAPSRQAEHRSARGRRGRLHGRQPGARRPRRLLHGLQGHVPVLRPRADQRARQRPAAVPPRLPPRLDERLLRRPAAAARRDHAARRAQSQLDLRPPPGPLRAPGRGRDARRHGRRARAHVQALRRLQAPHDAGRLRGLPARRGAGAGGAAAARARDDPPPAARGDQGRQPRPRSSTAAREAFGELGYGASSVRDIIRRTDLASGTFYNYFPDKESVFRALVEEVGAEARRRVRAARTAARTPAGVRRGGLPRVLRRSSSRTRRRSRSCAATSGTIALRARARSCRSAPPSWRRTSGRSSPRRAAAASTSTTPRTRWSRSARARRAAGRARAARRRGRDPLRDRARSSRGIRRATLAAMTAPRRRPGPVSTQTA